ncbi:ParB/RepB/Spo0J family partition protein [Alkalinema pantanalense CENA528]|uniref:ParB/RepB/Spo0J family partition protein n=1 Tax=Alkalinema pantanalense TaxID=1620705 RepID=UPI003D6E7F14
MSTRRKLSDAVASREELSFVFGTPEVQKEIQMESSSTNEQEIPRRDILCTFSFVPDGKPVRHYYDSEELQQWAEHDIKPNGIRSALWIRPHPTKPAKYELVAGLRRYKAAESLNLPTVPVKIFQWDDATAFQAAIAENANRRDFSALEELDNTLRILEIQLGWDAADVVSLLYRMNNAAKGTTNQNVLVSPEAEIVKRSFATFGKITWQSFVSSRLPLLKKPNDVLDAIRQGEIHYTKGIVIAGVKDPEQRQALIQSVKQDGMSVVEIKRQVSLLNQAQALTIEQSSKRSPKQSSSKPLSAEQFKKRLTQTLESVNKRSALWKDEQKLQKLERLLTQLEGLIN